MKTFIEDTKTGNFHRADQIMTLTTTGEDKTTKCFAILAGGHKIEIDFADYSTLSDSGREYVVPATPGSFAMQAFRDMRGILYVSYKPIIAWRITDDGRDPITSDKNFDEVTGLEIGQGVFDPTEATDPDYGIEKAIKDFRTDMQERLKDQATLRAGMVGARSKETADL